MSEILRGEKDSSLNANSYYDFKKRVNIIEDSLCQKCSTNNKDIISYSCKKKHQICFNCTFIYFMSTNFEGLTTKSITTKCPICQEGDLEINLDDYIKILELLLVQKNPNFGQEESNKRNYGEIGENKANKSQQKKVLDYCKQCGTDLCEHCLGEAQNKINSEHILIDVNRKDGKESKFNLSLEKIINNKEINELQKKEKIFMDKLEDDSIKVQVKLSQLIKDLNNLLQNYLNKIYTFQNSMKKIFQIINLTYYNYYTSNSRDKKEINISKKLEDFNLVSKNIDFEDLKVSFQKVTKEFSYEDPIFNFELYFTGSTYEEKFRLKSKEDGDCVTKILEFDKGNKLISSLINGKIIVWDVKSKAVDYTIDAHESAIWAMIELSDNRIATASSDKLIKVWDILNQITDPIIVLKERKKKNEWNEKNVKNVKNIKNVKNEKNVVKVIKKEGRGHRGTVFCLAEIEKNKLLSGSEDRTIKLWDLNLQECIKTLEDPYGSKINCLYVLRDPGFIVTGGDDNLLKIWNVYSTYVPNILSGHECTIWTIISINDDDSIIASGSSDNTIKIWDLISLKCLFTLSEHENSISSLKLLNNNLLASSSWDKTIKIWNLNTKTCINTLKGHTNIVWDVIQLMNGDLASCSSDKKIIIWSKNVNKKEEKDQKEEGGAELGMSV